MEHYVTYTVSIADTFWVISFSTFLVRFTLILRNLIPPPLLFSPFQSDRNDVQDELSELNPDWSELSHSMAIVGQEIKTNPDGDVDLRDQSYDTFVVPSCPKCATGVLKPSVRSFKLTSLLPIRHTKIDSSKGTCPPPNRSHREAVGFFFFSNVLISFLMK